MNHYTVVLRRSHSSVETFRIVARTAMKAIDGAQKVCNKRVWREAKPRPVVSVVEDFAIDRVEP
jgi:hypothetical protein